MELKIDLLKVHPKSVIKIILGIIIMITGIINWMLICPHSSLRYYAWTLSIIIVGDGIFRIYEGFGHSIESYFGNTYVWINEESIIIKSCVLGPEQQVLWKDISSMEYILNKYVVQLHNEKIVHIKLSDLDYRSRCEIRQIISILCAKKQIPTTAPFPIK